MTTHDSEISADTSDYSDSPDAPATDTNSTTEPDAPAETPSDEAAQRESTQVNEAAPRESTQVNEAAQRESTQVTEQELVPRDAVMDIKARWEAIQQGFVDDPRSAVTDADDLVNDVLEKLSAGFDEQRSRLESQWNDGEPDTEALRSALQQYRDFVDRLLSI